MILFEVRQQVRTINKRWCEVVYSGAYERPARATYEQCKADFPNGYFELVKVETIEDCLDFTPQQQGDPSAV